MEFDIHIVVALIVARRIFSLKFLAEGFEILSPEFLTLTFFLLFQISLVEINISNILVSLLKFLRRCS